MTEIIETLISWAKSENDLYKLLSILIMVIFALILSSLVSAIIAPFRKKVKKNKRNRDTKSQM